MLLIDADAPVIETEKTWVYLEGSDRRYRPVAIAVDMPLARPPIRRPPMTTVTHGFPKYHSGCALPTSSTMGQIVRHDIAIHL